MRFPIDVVFLDRGQVVIGIEAALPPWRTAGRRGAESVVELAAGECERRGIAVGAASALPITIGRIAEWAKAADARGILLIGDPPELGPYVLPGNNYHVYDIPLFWRNVEQDVAQRVTAWTASR